MQPSETTADDRRPSPELIARWRQFADARAWNRTGSEDVAQLRTIVMTLADEVVLLRGKLTAATTDDRLDEAVDWWFGARGQAVTESDQAEFRRRMRNAVNAALGVQR